MKEEDKVQPVFAKIPHMIMSNSGEYFKRSGKTMWKCNSCNSEIEVPLFVRGGCDIVDILDDGFKIWIGKGKLYFCPHCYKVIYSSGVGQCIKVDTEYKLSLLKKSSSMNYGVFLE